MAKRAAATPKRARPTLAQTVAEQKAVISKLVRARYDAAQTTEHNRNHWSMADYYSADAALAPEVRRKMRARARYERDNNAYLAGMASTLASDLIGTGPRLQLDCGPDADAASVRRVEDAVYEWFLSIDMARKLRLAKLAKVTDGEVFAIETTNRRLRGVQLDVKLIEADQVTSPVPELYAASVDGLRFDEDGNVSEYYVLKHHPGATLSGWVGDGKWYPADNVLHWFHAFRPGQHRGVGEVVPALELFAMLRRYTLAVVTAAETAADFAAIIKTSLPADGIATAQPAWETMPLMRGMATSIPDGWDAVQMRPEQPTSTYSEFTKRLINEIARTLNMPYIVAAMDSSAANYSSMRGDYLVYRKHLQCERVDLERVMLDPLVGKWLDEAAFVPGLIPDGLPPMAEWTWQWTWDGFEHVDPKKEADAMETRLRTHTTTLATEYQRQGRDWRQELAQRAEEVALMKELGLFVDFTPEVNYGGQLDPEEEDDQSAQAADGYAPPQGAREEARRGLEWRRKFGRGGTAVGVARARDIAGGRSLSRETINRMVSYFARHEVDKQGEGWSPGEEGYPSAGRIAWALWGGDAGRSWAEKVARSDDRAEGASSEEHICGTSTGTTTTSRS